MSAPSDEFNPDKLGEQIRAFLSLGEELFVKGSGARKLHGMTQNDLLAGCQVVPGPADRDGESPIYMVKVGSHPATAFSVETENVTGVPVNALAVILMHRLSQRAEGPNSTPLDEGAAEAMGRTLRWLSINSELSKLEGGE